MKIPTEHKDISENTTFYKTQQHFGKHNISQNRTTFRKTQQFTKHNISQNTATFKKDYGNDYMSVHNSFAEEIMYCGKKFQSLPRC